MCLVDKDVFKRSLKRTLILVIPFLSLPVFAFGISKESKCAYAMCVVIFYWVSEALPLSATALLPVVLFPVLDVMGTSAVCKAYMKTTTMIALGGLFLAAAIETSNIHKRLALKLLILVGISNKRLMPSFLIVAAFLSMWISNTTTALILVPILEAVSKELVQTDDFLEMDQKMAGLLENNTVQDKDAGSVSNNVIGNNSNLESCLAPDSTRIVKKKSDPLQKGLLLAIAYGANVGGTGTLTGTGPNLVLKGIMEDLYEESRDITYASWMMFGLPCACLCTIAAWIVLHFQFVRKCFQEASILGIFIVLKLLWFFEEPRFMPGWGEYLVKDEKLGGATIVIAMTSLLFFIPSNPKQFWTSPALLDWKTSQKRMHWGIVLILGGGFALAEAFKYSGLSQRVSETLSQLAGLPGPALVIIMCLLTATLTEFTSNVVTATVFLPAMAELSISVGRHPLYLMLPVTIACSFAFMLPVATPPNTVVCEVGHIGAKDMILPGFIMNFICCLVTLFLTLTWGDYLFNLNHQPEWSLPKIYNHTLA